MDGVRLDGDDDASADVIVPDVGEDDFLDDGALLAQHAHRLVHALGHVGRQAAFVPAAGQRDAHALDRTLRRGAVIDLGCLGRGLVVGIVARQHVEHQRVVLDRPGERARGVEAERQGEDAAAADQAVGRLDAGGAAEARRIADRAAGVGAHGAHAERGGDRRARAARRAAGLVVGVPGIARRREGLVRRHRAVGEFVGGELAEDDGAAGFQASHGLGIDRGHVVGAQMRMAGRQHALGLVDVLQPDRNAMQRAAIEPLAHLHVGLLGGEPRAIGGEGDEARDLVIDGCDAREESLGERRRGDLAARHQAAGLGDAERRQLGRAALTHRRGTRAAVRRPRPNGWGCAPSEQSNPT